MPNIVIDENIRDILPELDAATYAALEENILHNGCRDPIVLWGDIIIDGHNRYKICTEHNIPFNTVSKEFASREEALIWIILTQVARRSLTQTQLSYFRGMHFISEKKIITNEKGINKSNLVVHHNDGQPKTLLTAERLSEIYKVSKATIERDARMAGVIETIGEASPIAKRMILSGKAKMDKKELRDLSINSDDELYKIARKIEDGTYVKAINVAEKPAKGLSAAGSTAAVGDGTAAGMSAAGSIAATDNTAAAGAGTAAGMSAAETVASASAMAEILNPTAPSAASASVSGAGSAPDSANQAAPGAGSAPDSANQAAPGAGIAPATGNQAAPGGGAMPKITIQDTGDPDAFPYAANSNVQNSALTNISVMVKTNYLKNAIADVIKKHNVDMSGLFEGVDISAAKATLRSYLDTLEIIYMKM